VQFASGDYALDVSRRELRFIEEIGNFSQSRSETGAYFGLARPYC